MILSLLQSYPLLIGGNTGSMILAGFLVGVVTMFSYEISKREWIALLSCISVSMIAVVLSWLPAIVVFFIIIVALLILIIDKNGRFK